MIGRHHALARTRSSCRWTSTSRAAIPSTSVSGNTWDKGGFVLFYKRLEEGKFKLPHMTPEAMAVNIDSTQLTMLLDGIDFGRVGRPKRWKPPTPIAK